jgi:hypothetical protein
MEYIIHENETERSMLTTDSPASHHNIPVLRIEYAKDMESGDYGPSDMLGIVDGSTVYAAYVVASWGNEPERTADELDAARSFCSRWAGGPQVT